MRFSALVSALTLVATASAETHSWQGPTLGNWSEAGNWSTGQIPNAADDIAVIANTDAPGTDIQIAFSAATPVTIGRINVSSTAPANSVVLGATATATDFLTLATTSGQPQFDVASGTLRIDAPLLGTQGFLKTGAGTLSFRENPHAQTFTGPIGLGGGTLVIGADHDLGVAANDLLVGSTTTLLADPTPAATPLVLGPGRAIDTSSATPTLTLGNASDAGTLEIAGPLTGLGPLRFNGVGTLILSGANTRSGRLTYQLRPATPLTSVTRTSELRLVGADAVPAAGHALAFDLGSSTAQDTAIHARVDLGGHSRSLRLSTLGRSNIHASSSVLEITNGEVVSDADSLSLNAGGANSTVELRLPASTKLTRHRLTIGSAAPSQANATNSARVRIGTNAQFNLYSLTVGEAASSGRLDALTPGSTLRLRDGNGTTAMSSLTIGNFSLSPVARVDAVVDLSDVTLDAQISEITIGNGAPPHPATARLRFGAGTLQAGNITLGGAYSEAPLNIDYQIEQTGGEASVSGALIFRDGNATGTVSSRYILRDGTLALNGLQAIGNFTGTLRPRLEWSGGTLRNYPQLNANFSGPANPTTPFEIVLGGTSPKSLLVDGNHTMVLPSSVRLINTAPDVVLAKTGSGTLQLGAQTEGFNGTLQLAAGRLSLSSASATATLHAGSFVWDAGTLGFTLNPAPTPSNRLQLTGALTKTAAPSSTRVLVLSGSTASATHTLATYASTDLTLDDFTVVGVPANTAAEFVVGPSALTVTLHLPAGFTKWRGIYFTSASNLGPAHDLADPDADGLPNLLEYALGSEPLAATSAAPVVIAKDTVADRLTLTFPRIADPALTYTVRAANDPSGPWSGEGSETIFTSTGPDNTVGPVTATDTAALSAHPRRFLRLTVSR
ncbi:MAG: hypothetical protein H7067_13325 [Burkholderiales bacterium]|nr:hypothetical protein [Opitutaceae bacterium]